MDCYTLFGWTCALGFSVTYMKRLLIKKRVESWKDTNGVLSCHPHQMQRNPSLYIIQLRSGSLFGKSTRRGSVYRQSGFRHGCHARWNSLKYKWNLLIKLRKAWEPVPELAPSQGQFECSLIYKSTKFPDTFLWEKGDLLVCCYMDVFIFGVIIFVP